MKPKHFNLGFSGTFRFFFCNTSQGIFPLNYFPFQDLIRFIRRDDASHVLRRNLGQIGVIQSDLIPLLRDYSSDQELFDLVLRLLVNLTGT